MGLLEILNKPKEKKSLGVCIPDAHRRRQGIDIPEETISEPNAFRITGVFAVHDSIMLQGKMVQGGLDIGKEINFKGSRLKVKDILVQRESVQRIEEGESGAIFLNAKTLPILRAEDLIEF